LEDSDEGIYIMDEVNVDPVTTQKDINELDNSNILELQERLAAAEKALAVLSNTLHVVDATALLSLYSLIKTDNLRQPTFESNQDIINSGCSDAINRMMKTVMLVNANEKKNNGKDKTEGR
jgi:hypothetical protein